ncbi:hypothetical protein EB796_007271 [Bugula neritina]|uniref:Uncharacterized protein n=1 Tax=Bugula neritina TaxID=10212 RepID=A0A7J7K992_BUGNE|nr:hypothetical protein EB796_007271 [Bugula neritina]
MDLLLTAVYVIAALTTTGLSQETYVIPFVERSSLGQTFQSVLQDSFISGNLFVTLNAANSAQISIDAATDASECGVAINLTGNMQCLKNMIYMSPDRLESQMSMVCMSAGTRTRLSMTVGKVQTPQQ